MFTHTHTINSYREKQKDNIYFLSLVNLNFIIDERFHISVNLRFAYLLLLPPNVVTSIN